MAYVSQENKKSKAPAIKEICKRYGVKATLAVRNYSTLVLNIASGSIDFIGNYNATLAGDEYARPYHSEQKNYLDVNHRHFDKHFTGVAKDFLTEVLAVMEKGNYDNSDSQTDYFDVGFYIDVNVGRWDKPYVCTTQNQEEQAA